MVAVDLKITDFCPFNCPFCYQGSTLKGTDADLGYLLKVFDFLNGQNVFEVVLGGGEPTLHKHFSSILLELYKRKFTVGLTTKNKYFYKHFPEYEKFDDKETKYIYIGLSFSNAETIKEIIDNMTEYLREKKGYGNFVFTIRPHLVEGVDFRDGKELNDLIDRLSLLSFNKIYPPVVYDGILLLGYKFVERGKDYSVIFDKESIEEYLFHLKKKDFVSGKGIGVLVDSVIVENYPKVFEGNLFFREGEYTFYIDAVKREISISSFSPVRFPFNDLDRDFENFLKLRFSLDT
ncbi:MAG: radical SAM protein [Candidatus Aenigmatarchaeota archaeon]